MKPPTPPFHFRFDLGLVFADSEERLFFKPDANFGLRLPENYEEINQGLVCLRDDGPAHLLIEIVKKENPRASEETRGSSC